MLDSFGPNTFPCIVKIIDIPTCVDFVKDNREIKSFEEQKMKHPTMLECKNKLFSHLSGWIDLQVLSDDNVKSLKTEEQFVSVRACGLKNL